MADQDIEARAREVCSHCGGEGTVVTRHLWTAPCPVCARIAQAIQEERDRCAGIVEDTQRENEGGGNACLVWAVLDDVLEELRTQGGTKP